MSEAEKKQRLGVMGTLRRLVSMDRRLLWTVLLCGAVSVGSSVLSGYAPKLIEHIVDELAVLLEGKALNMEAVTRFGWITLLVYLAAQVLSAWQAFYMATVIARLTRNLRSDLFAKINRLPQRYFGESAVGDVMSIMSNDIATLTGTLNERLPAFVTGITQLVVYLVIMLTTNVTLALTVIIVTALGMVLAAVAMKLSGAHYQQRQDALGAMNGYVEEYYAGHDVVRMSRADGETVSAFHALNERYRRDNWIAGFLAGLSEAMGSVLQSLGFVAVVVVGSVLAAQDAVSLGAVVSFTIFVRQFNEPVSSLLTSLMGLEEASAGGERVFSFLSEAENPRTEPAAVPAVRGQVDFEHVRFSYTGRDEDAVIHDFSATVKPGQKVAIVGPSGAGKSTMINLLMRFFDIQGGRILIDGVPLTERSREEVHSLFAMVLQDTWLFDASIRENLCFNMEGLTDEQLMEACRRCSMDGFVTSQPNGLDTVLDSRTNISAGQKQLLTIARAMLQNRPMLILDEATSSVDTRTELLIQRAVDSLTEGRTSFVIAHRLSTIRNADLILVMKDGDIIEQGTHDALMAAGGFYAGLYNSQFDPVGE